MAVAAPKMYDAIVKLVPSEASHTTVRSLMIDAPTLASEHLFDGDNLLTIYVDTARCRQVILAMWAAPTVVAAEQLQADMRGCVLKGSEKAAHIDQGAPINTVVDDEAKRGRSISGEAEKETTARSSKDDATPEPAASSKATASEKDGVHAPSPRTPSRAASEAGSSRCKRAHHYVTELLRQQARNMGMKGDAVHNLDQLVCKL